MKYLSVVLALMLTANAHAFTDWAGWLADANRVWEMNGDGDDNGTGDVTALVGNNGTWTGTPSYTDPPTGFNGKAFVTSNGNYISCGDLSLTGDAMTYSVWFYPTSTVPNLCSPIMSRGSGANVCGILETPLATSKWTMIWNNFAATYNYADGPAVAVDAWKHIVVVVDGATANNIKIYENASLAGTISYDPPSNEYATAVTIGTDAANASTRYFPGRIYRPAIVSRALNTTEISVLYAGPPASGSAVPIIVNQQNNE